MRYALLTITIVAATGSTRADEAVAPQQIFEQRILPIFRSPNPSSCTQCHLAGVDLKHYIQPSHEKTFLSLRDQGLIDLQKPAESKILRLIKMGEEDRTGAALIHEKVRKREYEAFAAWVRASCNDPRLRDAPRLAESDLARPARPVEVIRHDRKDHLLESFERNIWSMRFRCMGCHQEGTPQNAEQRKKHGERVSWMKAAGAEATMNYLINESKLIDIRDPEKSLLLQKPLAAVKHEGGLKFLPGDLGYKGFRAWLDDYAAVARDRYATAADLPKERADLQQFGTDIWLKLAETPPEWGDKLLQVSVYAWDDGKRAWENEPVAMSDRGVWGKGKLWQHNLTLLAAKGSSRADAWKREKPALPPGRYLVKVYVDRQDRLAKDWTARLGEEDFVGQTTITTRWPEGYGPMTVAPAGSVRMP